MAAGQVELPQTSAPGQEYSTNPPLPIPSNYLTLYQKGGKQYGVPWQLVAAIGMAETGHGRNKAFSVKGAGGPTQFMPDTWASEGVDGNGDGKMDRLNPEDEIPATAKKLAHDGATKGPAGIRAAILAYNHSEEYLNSVVSYAKFYAGGKAKISAADGGDTSAATACDVSSGGSGGSNEAVGDTHASTAYEKAAVDAAQSQMGIKYVWGGGDKNGPTQGGYDCSGLALYVVAQATKKSGKELDLPHQSDEQHNSPDLATITRYSGSGKPDFSKMRPGDIIIFNSPSAWDRHPWNHVAIYIGNEQMIHAPNFNKPVRVDKVSYMGPGAWDAMRPKNAFTGGSAKAPAGASSSAPSSSK